MQIVTTHTNADFDALASLVAATLVYPDAVGILPGHMAPEVKAFLSIHQDLFRVRPRKGFELDPVDSLIVVDANTWKRLDHMEALADKPGLEIICWDHHMEGATIGGESRREEVGAAVTLLCEEMARQDAAFTPMHATLFLLGIYDDTGCLCFPSATARDAKIVAFLLENGADLNIVSAYLTATVDEAHSDVFSGMLAAPGIFEMDGLKIGLCVQPVKRGLTQLATLVEKFKEFKGLDAAVGIFPMENGKCAVIGRSNPAGVDVGRIMRELGGGGHAGAGSAFVKETAPGELEKKVSLLIREAGKQDVPVARIMSDPIRFSADTGLTMAQARALLQKRGENVLLFCDGGTFLGLLSAADVEKAERAGRMGTSVKGYMKRQVPVVSPEKNTRQALEIMNQAADGILPVVAEKQLVGVLTRGDLLLQIYTM